METAAEPIPSKRRPVNLTIREDILDEAKSLKLNASRAAERGIAEAVRRAKAQSWRAENASAIAVHNGRIEQDGTLLAPQWSKP